MSLPGNGIFVVQGEMAMLVTAMRRSTRWGLHTFPNEEYDVLMRTFQDLKTILYQVADLRELDPATYLSPFLEVIRSKETTGPVTSLALSAVHKFLSYGLIDPTHPSVPAIVEDIADAVTHARFVGTDHSSDGIVLLKILQVLRTLMLSPEGAMLTDESVCEIMLSCFRTCFETRLTELLRRNAEQCLRDMTQLIFMRLPQFPPEDSTPAFNTVGLSLKRRDKNSKKKLAAAHSTNSLERVSSPTELNTPTAEELGKRHSITHHQDKNLINEAEITIEPVDQMPKKHTRHSSMDLANESSMTQLLEKCVSAETEGEKEEKETEDSEKIAEIEKIENEVVEEVQPEHRAEPDTPGEKLEEYVNVRGIRFTPQDQAPELRAYGLACVRELFRFLISLCNPLDSQNTSAMVHLGLTLVGTALEVGADQIAQCPSLLYLVKDPLCRNLLSLLDTERISIFALDLQIWFLLFEALRPHLKYQMEAFFKKIIEITSADNTKATYELKEIHHVSLEGLSQIFRIPGLCTELYLNFDCDIYCINVFEEVTKLLSKNVVSSTTYNIHTLSLEVLMTIIEAIEMGTQKVPEEISEVVPESGRGGHVTLELGGLDESVVSDHVTHDISQYVRSERLKPTADLPKVADLEAIRNMKKWVTQGTEIFNQKPERGIEFLQEHNVLATPTDPQQVAAFLRENPDLDKKMIGEYICKRSSRGEADDGESPGANVLGAFADSFDYAGLRIDQALRLYLEAFRLPGEAPLIFLVMEKFAERWHTTNGSPFANTDAAFRLAYAVIMLNMDQHNHNAKKLNVPMTVEDFVRNLRGCNGSGDFDQAMLQAIFHSIKNEEMVMPAERVGPVRDAYLWRVLQRRGRTPAACYVTTPPTAAAAPHHAALLPAACPPAVTALSATFERSPQPTPEEIASNNIRDSPALAALDGLERCAALIARLPAADITVDTLLLTLCKFTGLLAPQHPNYIAVGVALGQSGKARCALRRACAVAARLADSVRAAWRHLLEILTTLYLGRLLPALLVEAEDYLAPGGKVSLIREAARGSDSGLLSSIYSYIALGESGMRAPTPHEKNLIDVATECVAKCNFPGLLITETKFLQLESLQELIRATIAAGTPPDTDSLQLNPQLEDITIFFLELLGQTLIQNRDRVLSVWEEAGPHYERVVLWAGVGAPHASARALTALLRTSARLMRCEPCAAPVLRHLRLLYRLPYKLFYQHADLISCGLYELVKTSAQNVHSAGEWATLLGLLVAAGAGAWPRPATGDLTSATSSRSEGSEDEFERRPTSVSSESELSNSPQAQGWIFVKNDSDATLETVEQAIDAVWLRPHRGSALVRCTEALALVIRDVAHVTPHNCAAVVRCLRLLAKAALASGKSSKSREGRKSRPSSARRRGYDESSDEELDSSHMVSIQLLDLMHTLHSRTAQIFKWWRDEADQNQGAEEYDLWEVAWEPLLKGIAEFCTDKRKQVANSGIAYLQRALLAPGLSALGGAGWRACVERVLLPLLAAPPARADAAARAHTLTCKVFLQHVGALSSCGGDAGQFAGLWARVARAQAGPLAAPHEPLREAATESLKNMLLVMHSVKIFTTGDEYNDLWYLTWDIIGEFLPNLKQELFPDVNDNRPQQNLPSHLQPSVPMVPTIVPPSNPGGVVLTSQNQPQRSTAQSPNILVGTVAQSPVTVPTVPMIPTSQQVQISPQIPVSQQDPIPQQIPTFQQVSIRQQIPTSQEAPIPQQIPTNEQQIPTNQQQVPTYQQLPDPPQIPTTQQQIPTYQQVPDPPQIPTTQQQIPTYQQVPDPPQIPTTQQVPRPPTSNIPNSTQNFPSPQVPSPPQVPNHPPVPVGIVAPIPINPTSPAPGAVPTPTAPVSGMVPIRNPLYDQSGLTSSVLLQPLNEMITTQISIQTQQPQIYRAEETHATEDRSQEIYDEYISNPYNIKDIEHLESKASLPQKSYSANVTPMHSSSKAQFGSTDNVRQDSSIFNFATYFGSNMQDQGSEAFEALMSTQEG